MGTSMKKGLLSVVWEKWKRLARIFAKINFNLIMTLFYFLIIGPVSTARKAVKLVARRPNQESYWLDRKERSAPNFKNQF